MKQRKPDTAELPFALDLPAALDRIIAYAVAHNEEFLVDPYGHVDEPWDAVVGDKIGSGKTPGEAMVELAKLLEGK